MIRDPLVAHAVHYVFEWLALAGGFWMYRRIRAAKSVGSPLLGATGFPVVAGCLIGAGLGNKLVFWLEYPHLWAAQAGDISVWFSGQSIVGGLLGGWLGVEVGKKIAGVRSRTGDDFVRPILVGILIGRIGCFLAGLNDGTYGLPTEMPWGIDFGDGIPRHPTQLYEWLLAAAALSTHRWWAQPLAHEAGLAFRALIASYLLWRLLIDAIKPVPYTYPLGLSGIQWLCLLGLLAMACERSWRRSDQAPVASTIN
ncbi:prolipoprotein diacylglyceryl transferase [Leptothrix ochracea]|uniref:prolipoprotein diacylglyceryl transferase n=4 Tax=Leptothrix ochracea TaxID=735331 RepID=UPI0034E2A2C7